MTRFKKLWLAAACLLELLSLRSAQAQRCDGIDVNVSTREQGCLRPGYGEPFKDCPECPELVVVPAGSIMMGASPGEEVFNTEREDQVLVNIAQPFAVGRFAVTRSEFAAFLAATAHNSDGGCYDISSSEVKGRAGRDWRSPGFLQDDRHPVVCVNWHDAKAYVAWLASLTGKGYRLLTETEREYVARAGSITPFWWGSTISPDQANYNGSITYAGGAAGERRRPTVPVDRFLPNPWGLYNVHGNAWDWTEDCWNPTNAGNSGDGSPRLTGDCSLRVIRGAGWNNAPHTLRSARRERERAGKVCVGVVTPDAENA